ncbi:MAG: hypothetical protein H0V19_07840 [Euzebyales bacterium]|nr:hypothetical protein [Euzebyales bacterium]
MDELELVCQQAARNLAARGERPLRPSVVLPLPSATKVTTLPEWPDADPDRFDLLVRFAADEMRPANAACYGLVAEAEVEGEGDTVDVVVVAYGARHHHPRVTAAPLLGGEEVGDFLPSEELDATALPFLSPLQHAADAATPPDAI